MQALRVEVTGLLSHSDFAVEPELELNFVQGPSLQAEHTARCQG